MPVEKYLREDKIVIPDFYRDRMEGQLSPFERKVLYESVISCRPRIVIEIGTWKGGGSTYIISSALHELGGGLLLSMESNADFHNHAVNLYSTSLHMLKPYIALMYGESLILLGPLTSSGIQIDYAILDGDVSADQTVKEFSLIDKSMPVNGRVFCHDWNTSKMDKMKDTLSGCSMWDCEAMMENEPTGSCIWRKKG